MLKVFICCILFLLFSPSKVHGFLSKTSSLPNIVFIVTDDQDEILGGMTPLTKVKALLQEEGTTFANMFTPTPLCCPSRASILTGRYSHNHNTVNNSLSGNCASLAWQKGSENATIATFAKAANYNTFFAGKYLNQYGHKSVGGAKYVPPGWDNWFALIGNSKYYNYTVSADGVAVEHGDNYTTDYFTDLIANKSVEFILKSRSFPLFDKPFFVTISTPAPHSPWDSAPQYSKRYTNMTAPRNGNWNHAGKDKHWLIRQAPNPMAKDSIAYLDNAFRKRWQTLLSVDDLVKKVVSAVEKIEQLDNTYFIFTSDNGYHLGQFSLPIDKRQLYEFDIRVPFIIRGPGVSKNVTRSELVANIDIAPTIADIVTGSKGHFLKSVDGTSLVPLFNVTHKPKWRTEILIEYEGEGKPTPPPGCNKTSGGVSQCFPDCVCEDAYNNTYSCVRTLDIPNKVDLMYCEFTDKETFVELYNHSTDPFQLKNIRSTVNPQILATMNHRLIALGGCAGDTCRSSLDFEEEPAVLPHSWLYRFVVNMFRAIASFIYPIIPL